MILYMKEGRALQVSGKLVYSCSGKIVGRIHGDKVCDPSGRYVGTVDSGRLVYRATDSGVDAPSFAAMDSWGRTIGNADASTVVGEEPQIPD